MNQPRGGTDFAVADVSKLELRTAPHELSVGITAESFGAPRPDLNGLRVKTPGDPAIFLVDQGYRRWIPNPPTYNNLFRDWNGIREDTGVGDIPIGAPIADGAVLVRGIGTAPIYLVDAGVKRWIASPAAMDKYYFSWDRVYQIPPILVWYISNGSTIS